MAPRLTASRTVLPPASHPRLCLAPCAEMPPLTWLRTNRDQMLGADACVRKYREARGCGVSHPRHPASASGRDGKSTRPGLLVCGVSHFPSLSLCLLRKTGIRILALSAFYDGFEAQTE